MPEKYSVTPAACALTQWCGCIVAGLTVPLILSVPHTPEAPTIRKLTYRMYAAAEMGLATAMAVRQSSLLGAAGIRPPRTNENCPFCVMTSQALPPKRCCCSTSFLLSTTYHPDWPKAVLAPRVARETKTLGSLRKMDRQDPVWRSHWWSWWCGQG